MWWWKKKKKVEPPDITNDEIFIRERNKAGNLEIRRRDGTGAVVEIVLFSKSKIEKLEKIKASLGMG